MKKFLPLLTLIILMFFLAGVAFAVSDVKLTVGSATTGIDQPVTIQIKAEPTGATTSVAGAAFTLQYNSALTVNVNSDFFDTFVNQGFTTEDGLEADGTIDSYSQPLVINSVASGADTLLKIAAARKDAGTISGPTVLFTLEASSSTQGTYSITLIPTNIDNDAAGYTTPQDIDLLIGAEAVGSADEFPVRLSATDSSSITYVENGSITIQGANDSDGDGLDDSWEITNFGDLTTSDGDTDFDQDGYSDFQEQVNNTNPTIDTTAGGTGYNQMDDYRVTNLDVDGSGSATLGTDGVLLLRSMFGFTDDALINGLDLTGCSRCTSTAIADYIDLVENAIYDVDGNGSPSLGTDGVLILREMFGFTDDALINGLDLTGCTRCTAEEIVSYIKLLYPQNN